MNTVLWVSFGAAPREIRDLFSGGSRLQTLSLQSLGYRNLESLVWDFAGERLANGLILGREAGKIWLVTDEPSVAMKIVHTMSWDRALRTMTVNIGTPVRSQITGALEVVFTSWKVTGFRRLRSAASTVVVQPY